MDLTFTDLPNGVRVAEVAGSDVVIRSAYDAVQIIGNASFQGADALLLDAVNLPTDFFDLSTGLAGEILQKCVNYRLRVAIVRADEGTVSESLRAFTVESNRGGHVAFVRSREEGLARLGA